jgi:hypothetical protein
LARGGAKRRRAAEAGARVSGPARTERERRERRGWGEDEDERREGEGGLQDVSSSRGGDKQEVAVASSQELPRTCSR